MSSDTSSSIRLTPRVMLTFADTFASVATGVIILDPQRVRARSLWSDSGPGNGDHVGGGSVVVIVIVDRAGPAGK